MTSTTQVQDKGKRVSAIKEVVEFRRKFGRRLGGSDVVEIWVMAPSDFDRDLEPSGSGDCIESVTITGPEAFDRAVADVRQLAARLNGEYAAAAAKKVRAPKGSRTAVGRK